MKNVSSKYSKSTHFGSDPKFGSKAENFGTMPLKSTAVGEEETCSAPKLSEAISLIRKSHKASTSFLQRRMAIGYTSASSIIDRLEQMGKIGSGKGPGTQREIYID